MVWLNWLGIKVLLLKTYVVVLDLKQSWFLSILDETLFNFANKTKNKGWAYVDMM